MSASAPQPRRSIQEAHAPPELTSIHGLAVQYLYATHGERLDAVINQLEKTTSLKREQLAYVGSGFLALYLVFGGLAQFICNLIGFGYPAYVSVKAIRTDEKDDDTKWLIYWTVFGFFTLIDSFAEVILQYMPFYWLLKVVFLLYLYLPITNGAEYMYKVYVDPGVTLFDNWYNSRGKVQQNGEEKPSEKKE